jgi:hypothetical protein
MKGGAIYQSYSTYHRAAELLMGALNWLDLVPTGREESAGTTRTPVPRPERLLSVRSFSEVGVCSRPIFKGRAVPTKDGPGSTSTVELHTCLAWTMQEARRQSQHAMCNHAVAAQLDNEGQCPVRHLGD